MNYDEILEQDIERFLSVAEGVSEKDIIRMVQCSVVPVPSRWVPAIEISIAVLGLIFNFVAIFVIIALKDFRKSISHWYVLQLAIADSLFLVMLPLRAAQDYHGSWELPHGFCNLYQGIFMVNYYSGIFFLTLMSFDRYVAIVHPVAARWRRLRTHGNAVLITIGVWILAIAVSLPLWKWSDVKCVCEYDFPGPWQEVVENHDMNGSIAYITEDESMEEMEYFLNMENSGNLTDFLPNETTHRACHHSPVESFRIWAYLNFTIAFAAPVLVMTVCYSLILWRVLHPQIRSANRNAGRKKSVDTPSRGGKSSLFSSLRLSSTSSNGSGNNMKRAKMSQKQRVTCIVVSLVVVFIVCWLPFHIILLWKFHGLPLNDNGMCDLLSDIASLLAFANSMLNPIFYTFLGSRFCHRLNTAAWTLRRNKPSSHRAAFANTRNTRMRTASSSKNNVYTAAKGSDSTIGHMMTVNSTVTTMKISHPNEIVNQNTRQRLLAASDSEVIEHQWSPGCNVEMKPILRDQ